MSSVPSPIRTVWINPPKYWAATSGMTDLEKQQLLERIEQFAVAGDKEALRQFSFVSMNIRSAA